MPSVKKLTVLKKASPEEFGLGIFEFTDDYSVFDYGKMPDIIPGKGESLCRMAAYNFQELEKLGLKTHYRNFVAPNKMEINLVQVLFPQKNELNAESKNYLIPLEVIFRNSLPKGSSVFKRLAKGQLKPEDIGLSETPEPGTKLGKPLIDVSTKLEETDRYLSWQEAQEMSFLSDEQLEAMKNTALKINDFINRKSEALGLEHADGKVEFALSPEKELILIDVCGTLDEDRMLFKGVHVSKQVLRDYYKTTPWYEALEQAKEAGKAKEEWPAPEKIPPELLEIVSNMYKSVAEAWTGEKVWQAPKIEEVMQAYQEFLEKKQ